eukprot:1141515-Pelagomonas_calceolata.AAC.2
MTVPGGVGMHASLSDDYVAKECTASNWTGHINWGNTKQHGVLSFSRLHHITFFCRGDGVPACCIFAYSFFRRSTCRHHANCPMGLAKDWTTLAKVNGAQVHRSNALTSMHAGTQQK